KAIVTRVAPTESAAHRGGPAAHRGGVERLRPKATATRVAPTRPPAAGTPCSGAVAHRSATLRAYGHRPRQSPWFLCRRRPRHRDRQTRDRDARRADLRAP